MLRHAASAGGRSYALLSASTFQLSAPSALSTVRTASGNCYAASGSNLLSQVRWKSDASSNGGFGSQLWDIIRNLEDNVETPGSSGSSSGSSSSGSAEKGLVSNSAEMRYREVLAVSLPRRPLFPGGLMPVSVQDKKLIDELTRLKKGGGQAYVGAFLRRSDTGAAEENAGGLELRFNESGEIVSGASNVDAAADLHEIGTFAQVHTIAPTESGAQLLLLGHRRLKRTSTSSKDPLKVMVEHLKDNKYSSDEDVLKATVMEMVTTLKELLHLHPLYNEQLKNFATFGGDFHDVSRLSDMGASLTSASDEILQTILEQLSVPTRAEEVLMLLKKEVNLCKLQADIGKRVEEKIGTDQRKYFLMEQLRSIKKELGLEKDDKSALIQKFRERLEPYANKIPEAASKVIEEELTKLAALEPASSEFNVTRNYLDWLTGIPWGHFTKELLDIKHAMNVLDEDHYGLEDVKERILEFIAVGRLRGSTQGKILCLVGPPGAPHYTLLPNPATHPHHGVGKTSVGKSIAKALDRKYFRFSVGGLSDVAEIKGHRRTYVGAMPGKVVQCLKSTGTSNPFVLIDEVDKLGRGYQGDPASALLELLDPEQNHSFLDHYLDVPVDLSKVLFMCTANVLDPIPQPLLDRMEVIRLSGYIADEKVAIARRYLEPQTRESSGVPEGSIIVTDDAMRELITEYAREAGVRNLKKLLEKIYRKAALQLVKRGVEGPKPPAEEVITDASEGGATIDEEITLAARKAAQVLTHSLFPGKKAEDIITQEELEAAGIADVTDRVSTTEDLKARIAAEEELPEKLVKSFEDAIRGSGRSVEAVFKALEDAHRATDDKPDTEESIGSSLGGSNAGSVEVAEEVTEVVEDLDPWKGPAITVDVKDLTEYVGQPPFSSDRIYERTPVGVVMGLAWTSMGGNALYIEAAMVEKSAGKGSLKTTGQLGDVMKESATIAHTFARSFLLAKEPTNSYFADAAIHMHVPAGGTPKDGPSAGCAIITAIMSLAMDKPVRPDLAMTGEVTLTGRVLPIGGVKEKTLAARRSGVTTLIFPAGNKRDFEELSDEVKEGLQPHFVKQYSEVYELALNYNEAEVAQQMQDKETVPVAGVSAQAA